MTIRAWIVTGLLVAAFGVLQHAAAEPANAGQNVQPIFEGWYRDPGGGFTMVFGYLNRNYVEHVIVPLGPSNHVEPGGPDRGQPAYFYPRMNRFAFSVTVPKDWGKKEVIWSVTAHGRTDQAVGWLQPEWEIDRKTELAATGRGTTFDDDETIEKNQAPTIKAAAVTPIVLPQALTLTATVADPDRLPPPDPPRQQLRVAGQETPPTLQGNVDSPVNVPLGPNRPPVPPRGRLTVKWIVFRGPAKVTFQPGAWQNVENGMAETRAAFTDPGEYVLRASASDGMYVASDDVRVTVSARPSPGKP